MISGYECLGAELVGFFDVAATQVDLDRIKKMSVDQARVVLRYGQAVIDQAIKDAGHLPGDGERQKTKWKLKWHEDALAHLVAKDSAYGAADDLKKWTQQAFVEFNAVKEGTAYAQVNWDSMLRDIGQAVAVLPDTIPKAILGSIPWWAWAGGAVVLGGGALFYFGPILLPYLIASKRAR